MDQPRGLPETLTTILLIEDDPSLSTSLSYMLRRDGYEVLAELTGEKGLATARERTSDIGLIVLDLMLPGMNGLHVLRVLRSFCQIPVLILSAKGEQSDKIDGLELGADDYVVKPFSMGEFRARVRANVRRRAQPPRDLPVQLNRGPITIEPSRRRVVANGLDLHLRPKEFALLELLALEPRRVFGRQELLDAIWGVDVIVDERTIDVHVSWLREKLRSAGLASDVIRTVYGHGYAFKWPPEGSQPAADLVADGEAAGDQDEPERIWSYSSSTTGIS